jgi:hypothetical protein
VFDVEGATVTDVSGGDAIVNGFIVNSDSTTNIVIGFSLTGDTISAGCGTLVVLNITGNATGLSDILFVDPTGFIDLGFEYYEGGSDCSSGIYDCAGVCDGSAVVDACGECGGDNSSCNEYPFQFNSSTLQAFYYFISVSVNGIAVDSDDWVGAFNGDVCVGARQWDTSMCPNGICELPVMGYDDETTEGYMQFGDIPTFKIYDTSANAYYDATPSNAIDPWVNFGLQLINSGDGSSCSGDDITDGCDLPDASLTIAADGYSVLYNSSTTATAAKSTVN